jgi:protein-disulfide isomerase
VNGKVFKTFLLVLGMVEEITRDQVRNENLLSRMRKNPWILATVVLGVLFVGALVFNGDGSGVTGFAVASENEVTEKVLGFLNQQVDEEVFLESIEDKGGYYELIVSFQGDQIPIQATLDGNFLIADLVPTDDSLGSALTGGNDRVEVEIGDSPIKGDPNAPITIVEFSDFECPFCETFYSQTLPLIEENFIDNGVVKLVFKDYPLSFHPSAQKAAEAARCVRDILGDEGYFEMHDKMFENQLELSDENFKKWASELGVDIGLCLESGTHFASIQEDLNYGASLGVSGTPGFFVNGIPIQGAQPYEVFQQVILSELEVGL